jgi:long-chain fatty acid transport protein
MGSIRGCGRNLAGAFGLVALLVAGTSHATPEDLFGYGPSSQAMGMTGAAIGRGFETVYTNPALLSESRDRRISLGFQTADYALHADGDNAPGDIDADSMKGVIIGATLPLGFGGALKDRITLGIGFFTPTDLVVRGRILYPEKPQFSLLADRSQSVAIQLGAGVDVGYGVRVGAGFAALAAIAGDVLVATNESGQVGTKVDDQLVATYAPVVGASYDIDDDYRVGATYRAVLDARFAVTIVVKDLGSLEVPPFNIAGVAQYDPRQVQFEAAKVRGPWRVAAGVTWRDWSEYSGPPEPTVLCSDENPDCAALRPPDFEFHDTFSPRVGVERVFEPDDGVSLHVRGGYALEPTPAPEQTSEMNFYDNTRHVLTAGYGIHLEEPYAPIWLDFFVQYHHLAERTHEKDDSVAPGSPGWPSVSTGGRVLVGGLVLGARL